MSIKIGYLDDDYDSTANIKRSLKKYDIELITMEAINDVANIDTVIDFVLSNELACLMVDYNLMQLRSKKPGTLVIKELNDNLPSFPCFLLTHYVATGLSEKIVPTLYVEDKDVFLEDSDSERFVQFIDHIKNSVECYKNRLNISLEEYQQLFSKYQDGSITSEEELKFHTLYSILNAYHIVDDIPDIMLYKETKQKLTQMLDLLNELDKKIEEK